MTLRPQRSPAHGNPNAQNSDDLTATLRNPGRTDVDFSGMSVNLLTGLKIERPNHVWAADLTYLPMAHGFLYLVAILDVASRKVLSFRVSNTMTPDFCVDALRRRWRGTAHRRSSTPIRDRSSPARSGPTRSMALASDQHGRQGTLDRQRVHRATVAQREVRGHLSACLREREPRRDEID